MKGVNYKLEIKLEGEKSPEIINGFAEYDNEKWNQITKICQYRHANITELIKNYLDRLTPEIAEEILFSWDI